MGLAGAFVLSTIPGLVAAVFYGMLRVTRGTYDATQAALVVKREERSAAADPPPIAKAAI
jgi:hypothetical protein